MSENTVFERKKTIPSFWSVFVFLLFQVFGTYLVELIRHSPRNSSSPCPSEYLGQGAQKDSIVIFFLGGEVE